MTDGINWTMVIVALITLLGTFIAALFAFLGHRQASEANDAVNRTHPSEPRIYDLVIDNTQRIGAVEKKVGATHKMIKNVKCAAGGFRCPVKENQPDAKD